MAGGAQPHEPKRRSVRFAPFVADIAAILVAVGLRFYVPPAEWVERAYSNGAYPHIDAAIRAISQPVPFSLGDALLIVVLVTLATWLFDAVRSAIRHRAFGRAGAAVLRMLAVLALVFVWFVLGWGLSYDRVPVAAKIAVDNERTNETSVDAFADRVAAELNATAPVAHAAPLPSVAEIGARLVPTFDATIRRLGDDASFSAPPIKPTIFQPLMAASGSDGFMDPWTHELNVDATLSPYERPAVYAHEWAHLSGFADESEANFIAVLSCRNAGDPVLRYSGWLLTWFNLPSNVHVTQSLSGFAAADVEAIRRRYVRQVNQTVAHANIPKNTLLRKIKKYGIQPREYEEL